jgi:hypothetical protein
MDFRELERLVDSTIARVDVDAQKGSTPMSVAWEDTDDAQPPDEPEAWQRYELYSQPDGTIRGHTSTNDDDDDGVPDTHVVSWAVQYDDYPHMIQRTGGTHAGCSGVQVTVILDGKEVMPYRVR